MIFSNYNLLPTDSNSLELIESEKERNLYYKFFAGFFFNELIDGYEVRLEDFLNQVLSNVNSYKLSNKKQEQAKALIKDFYDQLKHIHVSFDYHSYLWEKTDETRKQVFDRGEMSDIVLFSKAGFISVEAKFLSDFSFLKDIKKVQKRMRQVTKQYAKIIKKEFTPIQILLLDDRKLDRLKERQELEVSNLNTVLSANANNPKSYPIIIITWQDLVSIISNEKVRAYMLLQLKR